MTNETVMIGAWKKMEETLFAAASALETSSSGPGAEEGSRYCFRSASEISLVSKEIDAFPSPEASQWGYRTAGLKERYTCEYRHKCKYTWSSEPRV